MILDKLTNAELYVRLHPRLKKGLQFLLENDLNALTPGKYEIEGNDIFVTIQEYETIPPEKGRWESHYKYTDIQYMIRGEEQMGFANVESLEIVEQYKDRDLLFLEGNGDLFKVGQGYFTIFTPEDGHMPTLYVNEPQYIKKAVVKVRCD
ncbi:YhcH/YjgK/YiaL family protein [Neobacillus cucumis]|uniref:YhcH/YjgK/YiaL family protein n=1 Tax=Neobacillus cucumis TaxID=1740721 RepID=UPI0019650C7E|nr:YhcH/YjgK/YiaL family protein [Neobacillus cucumis]MBM7652567.1 YhcH/YjgK/YiaL family protein [Neobacillus cucumis]